METYALDLTRTAWSHARGDITVYGTWIVTPAGERPCMVLIPTHGQSHERATPCVVTLDEAWIWSEEIGDARRAVHKAMSFTQALGFNVNNPRNVFKVTDLIRDHLDDLIKMPPKPEDMRQTTVLGEAKLTNRETGKVREHEIIETF